MSMRFSQVFTKTSKDIPSDETSKNAQLLIRAGYVHKTMAGVYSFLPLGLRVLNKIEAIVRKNLQAIGGQEILMNSLHPKKWWTQTDRWDNVDVLFKIHSQTENEYALAPTNEEQVSNILKSYISSWKDLPEFQEFLYDYTEQITEDFERTQERYAAHAIIYNSKLNKYLVIDDSLTVCSKYKNYLVGGKIEAGETKEEALTREIMEETGIPQTKLTNITYLGKIRQSFWAPKFKYLSSVNKIITSEMFYVETDSEIENFIDPDKLDSKEYSKWKTKVELVDNLLPGFEWILKNYPKILIGQITIKYPLAVYQIQTKFRDELRSKAGLMRGREFRMKDMYDVHRSQESQAAYFEVITRTYHQIYRELGLESYAVDASGGDFSDKFSREFQVICEAGEDVIKYSKNTNFACNIEVFDEIKNNPEIQIPDDLEEAKSAEVGNIFDLGQKFVKAFDISYADENNQKQYPYMGCHGIGITRCIGVVAEIYSDEKGLKWPESVAPFTWHLVSNLQKKDDEVIKTKIQEISYKLYTGELKLDSLQGKLLKGSVKNPDIAFNYSEDVLWDDRPNLSIGQKLTEAELIGCPYIVIVSKKSLENGGIEVKNRSTGEVMILPL